MDKVRWKDHEQYVIVYLLNSGVLQVQLSLVSVGFNWKDHALEKTDIVEQRSRTRKNTNDSTIFDMPFRKRECFVLQGPRR
jgi:hypothetical protein